MSLQAIGEYIIIKAEREKPSGIITRIKTGEYDEKLNFLKEKLTVVSVGEDVKTLKEGDRVIAGSSGITRADELSGIIDGKDNENVIYLIAKENQIAAKI